MHKERLNEAEDPRHARQNGQSAASIANQDWHINPSCSVRRGKALSSADILDVGLFGPNTSSGTTTSRASLLTLSRYCGSDASRLDPTIANTEDRQDREPFARAPYGHGSMFAFQVRLGLGISCMIYRHAMSEIVRHIATEKRTWSGRSRGPAIVPRAAQPLRCTGGNRLLPAA